MKREAVVDCGALRQLRLDAGLALRKAEGLLGLAHGMLSDYERGFRRPPFTLIGPMATHYRVNVEEVLAAARRDLDARLDREEAARATTQAPKEVSANG